VLTTEATPEQSAEWKRIFEKHHAAMKPDRKTGSEVDQYFRAAYAHRVFDNEAFREMVAQGILDNEFSRSKLPEGALPVIRSYQTGNVLVGIDLVTGEFHVESEKEEEFVPVYDDLFVYRGLDRDDLKNFFLVAEYVRLTQK